MNLDDRIKSFATLGEILLTTLDDKPEIYKKQLNALIDNQHKVNPWFTSENVRNAIYAIGNKLTKEDLVKWTNAYPELLEKIKPLRAGVIMAGNIPLVGFHDFLSVLISGNNLIAKTSSKDSELIVGISEILCSINPEFRHKIEFTEGPLTNFDIIIATGSNNSSRYFEYYFGKYPNIIRKNRNSVAIIEGNETDSELRSLGKDIFSYFGLGCRNVSKIYLPRGYDISALTRNWYAFSGIIDNTKYANNYDFNKAVYLVNKESFYDTGFLLMKENSGLSSPVSVLHYEYYDSQNSLKLELEQQIEKIQCVVGRDYVHPGEAQSPHLWDYADGIDTIEFLLKKNIAGIL
ncbi:MAG: acyl-CoA reductase [Bacteroidota bacterium]